MIRKEETKMKTEISEKILEKIREGRQYRPVRESFRVAGEGENGAMIVEGHACTFNEQYSLFDGRYYKVLEQVDPAAFDECDMSDVIMQYNHEGRVFARQSNQTLEVSTDQKGLYIRANLGGTEIGRQLFEEIKGGYTNKMSFGFTVAEDRVEYIEDLENDVVTAIRTITKVGKLYDVSAVSIPANDGTDISARSFCDGVIAKLEAERLEKRAKIEKLKAECEALLTP